MNSNYIEQKKNNHLYFDVGGSKYAVDSDNVLEIMKLPALDYPQKLPNNVLGLLKYNNFVINVLDIRFYLNIDVTPYNTHNELIVVKTDEVIYGIVAGKVVGITPFDTANVDKIPYADGNMIVESLYKMNDETIFIINVYAIEKLLKLHNNVYKEVDIPSLFPKDEESKAIMTKRAKDIVEKAALRLSASSSYMKDKYISLNLNNDYYCISLEYVKEILKDTLIIKVPGIPDYMDGIMNLRGDYITVVNLKKFLGLPAGNSGNENEKNPVIIIEQNEMKLALLVDRINELFEYDEVSQNDSSETYYACEFINGDALYTVLNIEKIVSDKRLVVTDM